MPPRVSQEGLDAIVGEVAAEDPKLFLQPAARLREEIKEAREEEFFGKGKCSVANCTALHLKRRLTCPNCGKVVHILCVTRNKLDLPGGIWPCSETCKQRLLQK